MGIDLGELYSVLDKKQAASQPTQTDMFNGLTFASPAVPEAAKDFYSPDVAIRMSNGAPLDTEIAQHQEKWQAWLMQNQPLVDEWRRLPLEERRKQYQAGTPFVKNKEGLAVNPATVEAVQEAFLRLNRDPRSIGWWESNRNTAINGLFGMSNSAMAGLGLQDPESAVKAKAQVAQGAPINPERGNTLGTVAGQVPGIVAAGANPAAGAMLFGSAGVGEGRITGQEEGLSTGQTATLAAERGGIGALIGLIPGGKFLGGGLKGAVKSALFFKGVEVAQAGVDAQTRKMLGVKNDGVWTEMTHSLTSLPGWVLAGLTGAVHGVMVPGEEKVPSTAKLQDAVKVIENKVSEGASPKEAVKSTLLDQDGSEERTVSEGSKALARDRLVEPLKKHEVDPEEANREIARLEEEARKPSGKIFDSEKEARDYLDVINRNRREERAAKIAEGQSEPTPTVLREGDYGLVELRDGRWMVGEGLHKYSPADTKTRVGELEPPEGPPEVRGSVVKPSPRPRLPEWVVEQGGYADEHEVRTNDGARYSNGQKVAEAPKAAEPVAPTTPTENLESQSSGERPEVTRLKEINRRIKAIEKAGTMGLKEYRAQEAALKQKGLSPKEIESLLKGQHDEFHRLNEENIGLNVEGLDLMNKIGGRQKGEGIMGFLERLHKDTKGSVPLGEWVENSIKLALRTGKWTVDHIGMAADWVRRNVRGAVENFKDFSRALTHRFGPKIEPHVHAAWTMIQEAARPPKAERTAAQAGERLIQIPPELEQAAERWHSLTSGRKFESKMDKILAFVGEAGRENEPMEFHPTLSPADMKVYRDYSKRTYNFLKDALHNPDEMTLNQVIARAKEHADSFKKAEMVKSLFRDEFQPKVEPFENTLSATKGLRQMELRNTEDPIGAPKHLETMANIYYGVKGKKAGFASQLDKLAAFFHDHYINDGAGLTSNEAYVHMDELARFLGDKLGIDTNTQEGRDALQVLAMRAAGHARRTPGSEQVSKYLPTRIKSNTAISESGLGRSQPEDSPIFSEAENILPSGEKRAKAGLDPSMIDTLAGNLYSGDLGKIAAKELIQNAVDALRARGDGKGKFSLDVDTVNKSIRARDNGIGMSPSIMMKELVDVGGSKKAAKDSSGGFGIAKVAIFGNASNKQFIGVDGEMHWPIEVTSIARVGGDLIKTKVYGTRDDWFGDGLRIDSEKVPGGTSTGTTIEIKLRDNVEMRGYEARWFLNRLHEIHKLPFQIETSIDGQPTKAGGGYKATENLGTFSIPGADFEVTTSKEVQRTSYPQVEILNNGLPQFKMNVSLNDDYPMPSLIVVDVKSHESPQHENYPFRPDREGLRADAELAVKNYIQQKIVTDSIKSQNKAYQETIRSAVKMPGAKKGDYTGLVLDPSGSTPKEMMETLASKPYVQELNKLLDTVMKGTALTLRNRTGMDGYRGAVNAGISVLMRHLGVNVKGSGVDPALGDKNLIFHNPYSILDKASAMIERAKELGAPVSFTDMPSFMAMETWGTLVHEITHQIERSEGENFARALNDNFALLGDISNRMTTKFRRFYEANIEYIRDDAAVIRTIRQGENRLGAISSGSSSGLPERGNHPSVESDQPGERTRLAEGLPNRVGRQPTGPVTGGSSPKERARILQDAASEGARAVGSGPAPEPAIDKLMRRYDSSLAQSEPRKGLVRTFWQNMKDPFRMATEHFGPKEKAPLVHRILTEDPLLSTDRMKKEARNAKEALDQRAEQLGISEGDLDKMQTRVREINLPDGRAVKMTPMEMVDFIANMDAPYNRKQMNRMGLVLDRMKGTKIENRNGEFEKILSQATPEERQLASGIKDIFQTLWPKVLETYQRAEGKPLDKADRYYPISYIREHLGGTENLNQLMQAAAENLSLVQERTGGTEPVRIRSALDRFNDHINDASLYIHKTEPTRNAMMLLGNPEFRNALIQKFGKQAVGDPGMANGYWSRAILDSSGLWKNLNDPMARRMTAAIIRNVGSSKLWMRLSSILKQTSDQLNVGTEFNGEDAKYYRIGLKEANSSSNKEYLDFIKEHTGTLYDRVHGQLYRLATPAIEPGTHVVARSKFVRAAQETREFGMRPLQLSDMQASKIAYYGWKAKLEAEGLRGQELTDELVRRTTLSVERAQNPTTNEGMSDIARQWGKIPGLNMMLMFTSPSNKALNLWIQEMGRLRSGDRVSAVKNLGLLSAAKLVSIAVSTALGAAGINYGVKKLKGTAEDKDKERALRSMVLAATREVGGDVYLVGDALDNLMVATVGLKNTGSGSIPQSSMAQLQEATGVLANELMFRRRASGYTEGGVSKDRDAVYKAASDVLPLFAENLGLPGNPPAQLAVNIAKPMLDEGDVGKRLAEGLRSPATKEKARQELNDLVSKGKMSQDQRRQVYRRAFMGDEKYELEQADVEKVLTFWRDADGPTRKKYAGLVFSKVRQAESIPPQEKKQVLARLQRELGQ